MGARARRHSRCVWPCDGVLCLRVMWTKVQQQAGSGLFQARQQQLQLPGIAAAAAAKLSLTGFVIFKTATFCPLSRNLNLRLKVFLSFLLQSYICIVSFVMIDFHLGYKTQRGSGLCRAKSVNSMPGDDAQMLH